jgi:hypothetical protein
LSQARVRSTTQRRGKDLEANAVGHALDDLDAPAAEFSKCLKRFITEVAEPGREVMDGFDNERRSVASCTSAG